MNIEHRTKVTSSVRIAAGSTGSIRIKAKQVVSDMLESEVESNLAHVLRSDLPDYNPDWCPSDGSETSALDNKLAQLRNKYVDGLLDILFLHQNDVESATGCKSDDPITAAYRNDYIEDEDEEYDRWKILKQKSVPDSDGFMTEYTLYEYLDVPDDVDGNIYICMFGDSDLYPPDINYADYSTSNKKDALDWFNNFGEEEY